MDLAKVNIPRLEEWLRRLESGKYEQGIHRLRYTLDEDTRYCCLGVACEYAVEEDPGHVGRSEYDVEDMTRFAYNGESKMMPRAVSEFLGIDWLTPVGDGNIGFEVSELSEELRKLIRLRGVFIDYTGPMNTEYVSITSLNDNGFSFAEIADIIRDHILEPARKAQAA